MNTVGSYEAKTHLPALLARVERGERITITRHGHPIAMLVPPSQPAVADVVSVIARIHAFRKGRSLKGLSLRRMIDEGRR